MKKALKIVRNIVLVILALLVIFILVCFIMQTVSRGKTKKTLTEHGLCNLVQAGDIRLNVPVFGSENPDHTIVALPGSEDATFIPAMKAFSEHVSGNNRFVVVERPGYGLSDVGKEDMTVEYVVEYTHTALQNAGIEAPYVLMPHSLGGIYATYWLNTYPEEVEGVLFLDSVFDPEESMSIEPTSDDATLNTLESMGLLRVLFPTDGISILCSMLPEAYQEDADMLNRYRPFNKSLTSERALIDANNAKAWASIQATDIPKIYIDTDPQSLADVSDVLQFEYKNLDAEVTDDMIQEYYDSCQNTDSAKKRSEYAQKLGNCRTVNIPASHFLYLHKPDETAAQLEALLAIIH